MYHNIIGMNQNFIHTQISKRACIMGRTNVETNTIIRLSLVIINSYYIVWLHGKLSNARA